MFTQQGKSLFLFVFFLVFACAYAEAQKGSYVAVSGIGQITKLNNTADYAPASRTNNIIPENTYNPAFAVNYTYIYDPNFGLKTGLSYSRQGQRYSGEVRLDTNSVSYTSEVAMDYLRIPLKFQFSSSLDPDIKHVFLSIGAGLSFDVLLNVNARTKPGYDTKNVPNIDYRELYKPVSTSFVADAILNIRITDTWWINTGIKLNFGLSDVENKGYDYPDNAPPEWYFPVSTKKTKKPNIEARGITRHTLFGFELGIAYRFGDRKE